MRDGQGTDEEDRRRLCRERKVLLAERVRQVNRVKGCHSHRGYLTTNRSAVTGGRAGYAPNRRWSPAAEALKAQVRRELDREQIKAGRPSELLAAQQVAVPPTMLLDMKGIGLEFAAIL